MRFSYSSTTFYLVILLLPTLVLAQQSQTRTTPRATSEAERQAQAHYRVAKVALKNNDLDTALEELKEAARLAPNNALLLYDLASVQTDKNDLQDASENIQKAQELGLPRSLRDPASDLVARITYGLRKEQEEKAVAEVLDRVVGRWRNTEGNQNKNLRDGGWLQVDRTTEVTLRREGASLTGSIVRHDDRSWHSGTISVDYSNQWTWTAQSASPRIREGNVILNVTFEGCSGTSCQNTVPRWSGERTGILTIIPNDTDRFSIRTEALSIIEENMGSVLPAPTTLTRVR